MEVGPGTEGSSRSRSREPVRPVTLETSVRYRVRPPPVPRDRCSGDESTSVKICRPVTRSCVFDPEAGWVRVTHWNPFGDWRDSEVELPG